MVTQQVEAAPALAAYAVLERTYQDRAGPARAWRARGGKVVGYLCDNVPVEPIRAAGFMPFRLYGDADRTRATIGAAVAPVQARRFAGNEFVDAIFAQIESGALDFLDYLVVPHNRKAIQAFVQSIDLLRRRRPELSLPECHYLDRTYVRDAATSAYNQRSLADLIARLEGWAGGTIADDRLATAIADDRVARQAMRTLLAERPTGRLSGVEAVTVLGASHYLAPRVFAELSDRFAADVRTRQPRPGPRIYLGGSPLDHRAFYELVESLGATIVAEDHCWGARCAELALPDGAPRAALAARFDGRPACSIAGSIDVTVASVVRRCRAAQADAALFNVIRGDTAQLWETPSEVDALRDLGTPVLHLGEQPYQLTDDAAAALRERIAPFLASVAGRTAA